MTSPKFLKARLLDLLAEHQDGKHRVTVGPALLDDLAAFVVEVCNEVAADTWRERAD